MNWIPFIVIVLYFFVLILVGFLTRRFSRTSTDFFIAGRNMGITLVTVSIVGEWLGGMSTIGTSEMAYQNGFFPLWYNVSTAFGMFLFGLTMARYYRRNNAHTVGEMLENLYNRHTRVISSLAFIIAFIILSFLQLKAIGSVMTVLFGIPFFWAVILSGIIIFLYVYKGGMLSIAFTNLIHIILLYSTIIIVFYIVFTRMGGYGGIFSRLADQFQSEGMSALEAGRMVSRYKNPMSLGISRVLAWLLGGILSGFASQACIQPVFSAKDIKTAKYSSILSAFLIAPLGLIISTLGIAVRTGYFGPLEGFDPKNTLPFLLLDSRFFPPLLSGLASAGIIAAILSTVAPVMFAISTILIKDFYHRIINEKADEATLLRMSKRSVLLVCLITVPLAIFLEGGILEAAYITYGIRASAAIVVISGIIFLDKRTNKSLIPGRAACYSILVSTAGILIFVLFKRFFDRLLGIDIDKVYISLALSILSLVLMSFLISRRTNHDIP